VHYVLIAEHDPEGLLSSADTLILMLEGLTSEHAERIAHELGIQVTLGPLQFGPAHVILVVFDAPSVDPVVRWAMDTGLVRWNSIRVHQVSSSDEMSPVVVDRNDVRE
jgi:hypothetical protein